MTLREEIKDIMKRRGDDWRRNHMRDFDINDNYTDEVVSKIEKRIDEREKKLIETMNDDPQVKGGYLLALNWVKEMLK